MTYSKVFGSGRINMSQSSLWLLLLYLYISSILFHIYLYSICNNQKNVSGPQQATVAGKTNRKNLDLNQDHKGVVEGCVEINELSIFVVLCDYLKLKNSFI